jgi:dolichol-phosphate mannosyltransferase
VTTPAVIVPTYNEAGTIGALVEALLALPCDPVRVFVVDDASPDATAGVVEALMSRRDRLRLIRRPAKLGLGTAYSAGFAAALAEAADPLVTMDGDLSHEPAAVPSLLAASREADLVIGSRYVPGGGVEFSLARRLLSRLANRGARRLLHLRPRDCTSGFRSYRAGLLSALPYASIRSHGYSYLVEMLGRCQGLGARIDEVPIVFRARRSGRSKISVYEIARAVRTVVSLRLRETAR